MAKLKINKDLAKAGSVFDAQNAAKLQKENDALRKIAPIMVGVTEIVTREPFCTAYELKDEVFDQINRDIRERGYDDNHPVIAWRVEGEIVLLDGHRRLEASKQNSLIKIPVRIMPAEAFADDTEALLYIRQIQHLRRNLSVSKAFAEFLEIGLENLPGQGQTRAKIMRIFGVSDGTAKKWVAIYKEGQRYWDRITDPDDPMTPSSAYEAIQAEKQPKEAPPEPEIEVDHNGELPGTLPGKDLQEDESDHTDDEEGKPRAVSIKSPVDEEPKLSPPEEDPQDQLQRAIVFFRDDLFTLQVLNGEDVLDALLNRLEEQHVLPASRIRAIRKRL